MATTNGLPQDEQGEDKVYEGNFERLHMQARHELDMFMDLGMADLIEEGCASHGVLVSRLNDMFIKHLECTWVPITLRKIAAERKKMVSLIESCAERYSAQLVSLSRQNEILSRLCALEQAEDGVFELIGVSDAQIRQVYQIQLAKEEEAARKEAEAEAAQSKKAEEDSAAAKKKAEPAAAGGRRR